MSQRILGCAGLDDCSAAANGTKNGSAAASKTPRANEEIAAPTKHLSFAVGPGVFAFIVEHSAGARRAEKSLLPLLPLTPLQPPALRDGTAQAMFVISRQRHKAIEPGRLVHGGDVEVKLRRVGERDRFQREPGVNRTELVDAVHAHLRADTAGQRDGRNEVDFERG